MKAIDLFNAIKRLTLYQVDPISGSNHRLFNSNIGKIRSAIKFFNENQSSLIEQFNEQPFNANECPKNYAHRVKLPAILSEQDQNTIHNNFAKILEESIPKNKVDPGSNYG